MNSPSAPAVIVTGAAGFIGSHLCRALLGRGTNVVGLDNFDPFYSEDRKLGNLRSVEEASAGRFDFVRADICDAAAMQTVFRERAPVAAVHLAALAGVRPSIAEPARYARVNVDGLVNVLDGCRAAGCRRVVFASSSSVYGNNAKVPFSETDPVDEPISPYAATKRAGELICHTYGRLFGMSIAALRFFTVFGPAQRPDLAISQFMRRIAAGEEVPMFGDGTTSRDYTYIDDIIAGALAAFDLVERRARSDSAGFCRVFNLGGSQPVALLEMIEAIAKVVGRPARIKRLPMQPGDVERTFADLARSEGELGYRPRTTFHDGLSRQWEWLRGEWLRESAAAGCVSAR